MLFILISRGNIGFPGLAKAAVSTAEDSSLWLGHNPVCSNTDPSGDLQQLLGIRVIRHYCKSEALHCRVCLQGI